MQREQPAPRVLVLGGGFAGLEAAFYLRMRLGQRVQLTLVSDRDTFLFKPNTIYVPFGKPPEAFVFPILPALERRGVAFVKGRADAVDPARKVVRVGTRELPYDHLLIATGASMRPDEVPGMQEHAYTIWTPDEMLRLRRAFQDVAARAQAGQEQRVQFLVPPNNKCSGPLYEMVLMLDTWLRRQGARDRVRIAYATYERSFIQAFGPRLDEVVRREFAERGIEGSTERVVKDIGPGGVHLQDGDVLPYDVLVTFPPYVAATRFAGLPSDERGFLLTEAGTRQVRGQPDIYAVGDAGDFPVKQAFLGLLQADAAAEHLATRILGEEAGAPFDPVSMCIMEQFDKATFAQVPLRTTGDPARPVEVRPDALEDYRVGTGEVWRMGKKMLGAAIPHAFKVGKPFHAGPSWATMEAGLRMMKGLFTK